VNHESAAIPPTETEILDRMRRGQLEAFEEAVELLGGRMLAVARRYLPNDEDAREAVQQAFLNAYRALPSFHGDAQLGTWLHRITVNACLMKLRTNRRRPETPIEKFLPTFVEDGHQTRSSKDWSPVALRGIERSETRAAVREAIDKLPENYRIVLMLRDIEEFTTEQAADLMGLSTDAVKTRLHRARQALRGILDSQLGEMM
jgi:RNA polymerase sigma-70 factor (ECF subfamily)